MPTTLPADFSFEPKVWKDHISAYFDRKLVLGQYALMDNTLTAAPGETVNFPYFKAIGDAEKPSSDEALSVDKMQDDSFSCTVYEVAKAVGIRRSALRKSAAARDKIFAETQSQIGRVHSEQIDKDLIAEINTSGNYVQGYTATAAATVCTIHTVNEGLIVGFGDKSNDAVALFMHSKCFLSFMNDTTSGFLKADATDPMYGVMGFKGRVLGMALFVLDTMPAHTAIDSKLAFEVFAIKENSFGIMTAEEPDIEMDYDLLHREYVFAGTQYYGVKAFHAKINANDKKICRMTFTTAFAA